MKKSKIEDNNNNINSDPNQVILISNQSNINNSEIHNGSKI